MAAPRRRTLNNNQLQRSDRTTTLSPTRLRGRRAVAIYVSLAFMTLAVFSQTLRHNFVNFDDDLYVYNANTIKAGLTVKGIISAFTNPHAHNWHPLTTISH